MSTNLEEDIQEKLHRLPNDKQRVVLEFIERLELQDREQQSRLPALNKDRPNKAVDLRQHGINREQAAELRAGFAAFEDWNDPEMEIYDDYDNNLASLRQNV
jgi:hypothetical protein